MHLLPFLTLISFVAIVSSHVYFQDDFSKPGWENRWIVSSWKQDSGEAGKWDLSAGKLFGNEASEKGLRTTEDARFYDISAKFDDFSNKGKTLVVQFSVKHEQNIDCGGGYVKLVPHGFEPKEFRGGDKETTYNIMFGPDICGATKKVHLIFHNKGTNHLIKKNVAAEADEFTHLYTAVIEPDNTYRILVDGEEKQSGKIEEDWDILPPKKIKDPQVSKPLNWVDERMIDDPNDKKPEGYDDIPSEIADPDASKPDDWDDELDGDWEAPKIANPEYKGEWAPKKIDNPEYKGEWVHPEIDNPDYSEDPNLYAYDSFGGIGIDIWQVKSGTIFDNFLITDDFSTAESHFEEVKKRREGERKVKEERDKEEADKRAAEAKEKPQAAETDSDESGDEHAGHDHEHEDL